MDGRRRMTNEESRSRILEKLESVSDDSSFIQEIISEMKETIKEFEKEAPILRQSSISSGILPSFLGPLLLAISFWCILHFLLSPKEIPRVAD